MKRDQLLELRILTGTHAGARVLLPDAPQILGCGDDCDLILSDDGIAPQHARLEVQDDGSVLLHLLDAGVEALVIRSGEGAMVGDVTIALADADAPWQDDVPLAQVAPTLSDHPGTETDAVDAEAAALAAAQALAVRQADERRASRRAALAWLTGVAVAAAIGGTAAWRWQQAQQPAPTAQATTATPAAPPPAVDPVDAVVAQFNLGQRVRVERRPGQPPAVLATLLSQDDTESLALALSRLSPRPGLRLTSEQDLQSMVADAVDRQSMASERPLKASYLGDGNFRLEGRVTNAQAKQAVLDRVRADVPQALGFEQALVTDGEALVAMVEDLQREGFADTRGQWVDGVAQLKLPVATTEMARWERVLQVVAGRHRLPFRAMVDPVGPALAGRDPALRPPDIRSIVSGVQPYVVLADGSKLMVDGTTQGLRLVEVQPRAVIFEASGGRRVAVER